MSKNNKFFKFLKAVLKFLTEFEKYILNFLNPLHKTIQIYFKSIKFAAKNWVCNRCLQNL